MILIFQALMTLYIHVTPAIHMVWAAYSFIVHIEDWTVAKKRLRQNGVNIAKKYCSCLPIPKHNKDLLCSDYHLQCG
jgi:hypothetical protein